MSTILDKIEEKKTRKPAQVKIDKALHDEVSKLLAKRGTNWQDMLYAAIISFKEECSAQTKKSK